MKRANDHSWLTYRARDGVVETHLDPDEFALYAFFDRALEISESCAAVHDDFRLLDTFLSARADYHLLERVVLLALKRRESVRLLLADPHGSFAVARANSIGGNARHKTLGGLRNIAEAVFNARETHAPDIESLDVDEALALIRNEGGRLDLEIRFYSAFPSGPMYFLHDLLLSGRFGAIRSAFRNPWWLVVNDPAVENDLYDVASVEFEAIWKKATELPGRAAVTTRPPAAAVEDAISTVEQIWTRFHLVASQLVDRGATLKLTNERTVQILLASLLRVDFDNVVAEEATPTTAGRGGRVDLLLPDHGVAIEVKLVRGPRDIRRVSDELILARTRYGKHPGARTLLCLVFDPDFALRNRAMLQTDLETDSPVATRIMFTPP